MKIHYKLFHMLYEKKFSYSILNNRTPHVQKLQQYVCSDTLFKNINICFENQVLVFKTGYMFFALMKRKYEFI